MGDDGRFRRGVGTPPYARILNGAVGRPALWPPPKACGGGKLPGRDESLPYESTEKGGAAVSCGPHICGPYR